MNLIAMSRSRGRRRLSRAVAACSMILVALGVGWVGVASAAHKERRLSHRHASTAKTSQGVTLRYEAVKYEIVPGEGFIDVHCPAHYFAVGGGYFAEDSHIQVLASAPYNSKGKPLPASPDSWSVAVNSTATTNQSMVIFVVCLSGVKAK